MKESNVVFRLLFQAFRCFWRNISEPFLVCFFRAEMQIQVKLQRRIQLPDGM